MTRDLTPLQNAQEDLRILEGRMRYWEDRSDTQAHWEKMCKLTTQLEKIMDERCKLAVEYEEAPQKLVELSKAYARQKKELVRLKYQAKIEKLQRLQKELEELATDKSIQAIL